MKRRGTGFGKVFFYYCQRSFIPATLDAGGALCRLLLCEAVQGTETPDQIHGVDADHGPVAEQVT